jgi:hypothetical protein
VNVFHNGTPDGYIKMIIETDKVCKEGSDYCPVTETNGQLDLICSELLIQYKHDITEHETFNHICYDSLCSVCGRAIPSLINQLTGIRWLSGKSL